MLFYFFELLFILEMSADPTSSFPKVEDLQKMMEERELSNLASFGGINGLYQKLNTSEKGLNDKTLMMEKRQEVFASINYF